MALVPGTALGGRYRLIERLGEGTFGDVWRGRDRKLGRDVAVKVLREEHADRESRGTVERFYREASILARLNHPGITTVFDSGEEGTRLYIVMELLRGTDLRKVTLANPGGLPIPRVLNLAIQAAEALAAAHGAGVLHRDLKPENLFVLEGDRLKICDFGLAWAADSGSRLTRSGEAKGTPEFMSPEQFDGLHATTERSDLYSLGCVLYEMITGGPPFPLAHGWTAQAHHHCNVPASPPRGRYAIPTPLSDLVLRLLAKKPDERPRSAAYLADELRRIAAAAEVPPQTPPAVPQGRGAPSSRRPPGVRKSVIRDITAADLRGIPADRAAHVLEQLDSPRLARKALNSMTSKEIIAILQEVNPPDLAAQFVALIGPMRATVLAGLDTAAKNAYFQDAPTTASILKDMKPQAAAAVVAGADAARVAAVLAEMNRPIALEILDKMELSHRREVTSQMTSPDALLLHEQAKDRLRKVEAQIEAARLRRLAEERELELDTSAYYDDLEHYRQRQALLMPWTWSVRLSAAVLFCLTVGIDIYVATAGHSALWLILYIPVGLGALYGVRAAWMNRFGSSLPALGSTASFVAATVICVTLVSGAALPPLAAPVIAVATACGAIMSESPARYEKSQGFESLESWRQIHVRRGVRYPAIRLRRRYDYDFDDEDYDDRG